MKKILFFTIILAVHFAACSKKTQPQRTVNTPPKNLSPLQKVEQLANETYQTDYEIRYNKPKTVACIYKTLKPQSEEASPTLSFLLYDPVAESILLKETVARGSIKWINDAEVEVRFTPERVAGSSPSKKKQGYVFNVQKLRKIKL